MIKLEVKRIVMLSINWWKFWGEKLSDMANISKIVYFTSSYNIVTNFGLFNHIFLCCNAAIPTLHTRVIRFFYIKIKISKTV